MDRIALLANKPPKLHVGGALTYGVSEDVLREISRRLSPGINTLETGCGMTTIVFAQARTKHCCVTPVLDEAERVRQYCATEGIGTDQIDFHIGSSSELLPKMSNDGPLDFVFIDGAHPFPYAILDFHYTEVRVPVGGMLGIDDCQIPSVRVLLDFLNKSTEWRLTSQIYNTVFFVRLAEALRDGDRWQEQPFNDACQPLLAPSFWQRVRNKLRREWGRSPAAINSFL